MRGYVCVHGHFYQPPRENPWLEAVEQQDGAYPYHDWNERITAECYEQNAASRVLDDAGRIVRILNNYAHISFDVGPTLLAWMQDAAPDTYAAILAADRESRERFSGHGSAVAQAYNHIIMPLANDRDRHTQVAWGVADFRHRFDRDPEGMWLPETAVDVATLEVLAAHGIAFTVLAPHQAARVRDIGAERWTDVTPATLDLMAPYEVALPSGRRIAVFFYDGPLARAVAFEGLLGDGAALARRLREPVRGRGDTPRLVSIATDGESYGHHHRHGDMALAFAIHQLDTDPDVRLTNYAEFLALRPPTQEVEIAERTSWSCTHGLERWRADCGCADGGHPGWQQSWRRPLREALDWLRDELAPRFEAAAGELLTHPWAARDGYIDVLLDRSSAAQEVFLDRFAARDLDREQRTAVWKLLEMQRHALLMYTSCGWFFDDLGRIETVQVLRYAGRVVQLAREMFGDDLETHFLERLAAAKSNEADVGDGRDLYAAEVRPAMVDADKLAAHYAVSSLFEGDGERSTVGAYEVTTRFRRELPAGAARLAVGRVEMVSRVTGDASSREFGVLHLGDHNFAAGVRPVRADDDLHAAVAELETAFTTADFPETLRRLDHHFRGGRYSLKDLFRDERQRILRRILDASVEDARAAYRRIYRDRAPLMRYLTDVGARLPRAFLRAAEIAINDDLRQAFGDERMDLDRVEGLLADARTWDLQLDTAGLAHALSGTIQRAVRQATQLPQRSLTSRTGEWHGVPPAELAVFDRAAALVALARSLPFEVDLWAAQNLLHDALVGAYPELRLEADIGDPAAATWVSGIATLGEALAVAVD